MGRDRIKFDSISQRVIYGLLFSFSDFKGVDLEGIDENLQLQWHDILSNIVNKIYKNPELLGLTTDKDDYFRLHQCNNTRPQLIKTYKKIIKDITNFYNFLYFAGIYGEIQGGKLIIDNQIYKDYKISFKPQYKELLLSQNIICEKTKDCITFNSTKTEDVIKAWQLLAKTTKEKQEIDETFSKKKANLQISVFKFACGVYSNDLSYLVNRVEKLYNLEPSFFHKYEELLLAKGYSKKISVEFNHNSFIIMYHLIGGVSGFSISYHFHKVDQFYFSVLNGIGAKAMLMDFDSLSKKVKRYLIKSCRPCNSCKLCTKGGKVSAYTVDVEYKGEKLSICPSFPNIEWLEVDEEFMDALMEYIELQEVYGNRKKK